jgi:hypothetical protein
MKTDDFLADALAVRFPDRPLNQKVSQGLKITVTADEIVVNTKDVNWGFLIDTGVGEIHADYVKVDREVNTLTAHKGKEGIIFSCSMDDFHRADWGGDLDDGFLRHIILRLIK